MILRPSSLFGWRVVATTLGVAVLTALVVQAQFPPVRPSTVRGIPDLTLAGQSQAIPKNPGPPFYILMPPNPAFPSAPPPTTIRPGTPAPSMNNPPLGLV